MEYINLKAQYSHLEDKINENIRHVLENANFIMGDYVGELEQELAEYVGVKNVIACSNGTAALQLIYMAYGIGAGDAVFCPDMTFIASIEPAVMLGAVPVFCEIDAKTYNIDPDSLEKQINAVNTERKLRARAIVAVDFLGNPAVYERLSAIAKKYDLLLIEDAAQGVGADIKGRKCGSFGDIAATSFFPSKPLGCYGDGGAVFTNDDETAQVLRSLRVHGKGIDKYHNIRIGINSRLDTIQAAILLPKLRELPFEIEKRQEVAAYYEKLLKDYVVTPYVAEDYTSAFAQYVVMAEDTAQREKIRNNMQKCDIPSLLYYPCPMHNMPVFQGVETYGMNFDNTVRYSETSFGIPFSPYITKEEQEQVARAVIAALQMR